MKTQMIDTGRIEAMMAQLKAAASRPQGPQGGINPVAADAATTSTKKVGFGEALKASLDQVNQTQQKSEQLGQAFMTGDDKVSLSDVMISMQKANINFQATVQVRNKLVSAYHDIMNMQV
ncbi:flagellar hook-basal body complex protein FliE [Noviherbaspirillum sedimenti]|uniref:Flagellar hook-basal body complex protein FliE n=1 Tax=Noviherbaspirillum sedimenti TaxID=2320865 RepID=A0A3A3FY63_9BURK|nr:flagellar hook-basal body complex protein FliE [Noviherbaspirillum sedimenti]RJG01158.1 flagellar hook-basal body complex protein FliE [Noviherbaspirillum sedimenti]